MPQNVQHSVRVAPATADVHIILEAPATDKIHNEDRTVLLNQVKQWDIHAKQSTDSHVNSYILIEGGKGGV